MDNDSTNRPPEGLDDDQADVAPPPPRTEQKPPPARGVDNWDSPRWGPRAQEGAPRVVLLPPVVPPLREEIADHWTKEKSYSKPLPSSSPGDKRASRRRRSASTKLRGWRGVAPRGGERDTGGLGGLLGRRIANRLKFRGQLHTRTKFNLHCFAPLQG